MANYTTLKASIEDVIKPNGNEEIKGQVLQNALIAMIESLGADYQFVGVATPETNPGTPDQNIAYLAGPGTYANFGTTVVRFGEIGLFKYNGAWDYTIVKTGSDTVKSAISFFVNTQAGSTVAKTVEATNYELMPGGCIKVKFDNANTANNPTLNVNNTGAYPMYFNGGVVSPQNTWKVGETVLFYLDNYMTNKWMGVRLVDNPDFVNVNALINDSTPFGSVALARASVPVNYRKSGLNITYLLSGGWFTDQFIGDDITDWSVADNWKTIGPVSVSQNTETGKMELRIGLGVGFIVDKEPEIGSKNLIESGALALPVAKTESMIETQDNLANPFELKDYVINMSALDLPFFSLKNCALINYHTLLEYNTTYNTSNLIPVEAGATYICNTNIRVIRFFKDNGQPIDFIANEIAANTVFSAPANAAYMRVSISKTPTNYWRDDLVLCKGTTIVPFTKPYRLNPCVEDNSEKDVKNLSQKVETLEGLILTLQKTASSITRNEWVTIFSNLTIKAGELFYFYVNSNIVCSKIDIAYKTSGGDTNHRLTKDPRGKSSGVYGLVAPEDLTEILVKIDANTDPVVSFKLTKSLTAQIEHNGEQIKDIYEKLKEYIIPQANLANSLSIIDFYNSIEVKDNPLVSIKDCALTYYGEMTNNAQYNTTNLIQVEGGGTYICNTNIRVKVFLDAMGNFLSGNNTETPANTSFSVPANAAFMRVSISKSRNYWRNDLIINKGTTLIEYIRPYKLNSGIEGSEIGDIVNLIAANSNAIVSLNNSRTTDENNISSLQSAIALLQAAVDSAVFEVGGVTYDTVPTQNSPRAITSGGVYTALQNLKGTDNLVPKLLANPVENIIRTHSMVGLFHDWGVCGASYDSGEMNYNNNQNAIDMYDFSWLQVMCRINGVEGYNFSAGGWTAKTWCNNTSERGWGNGSIGASANLKKAYVISFGENDQKVFSDATNPQYTDGNGMAGDLATDINTTGDFAPTNSHDTFAGWIACMIQRLKSVQPKAVFFVKTMWHNRADDKGVNTVLRDLPNYFTNVFIIDIYEYYPSNMFDPVFFTGGHPNALGYEYFGAIFNTFIDNIIRNNETLLKQVQFIGTEYEF